MTILMLLLNDLLILFAFVIYLVYRAYREDKELELKIKDATALLNKLREIDDENRVVLRNIAKNKLY